jgi:hypothetical protein
MNIQNTVDVRNQNLSVSYILSNPVTKYIWEIKGSNPLEDLSNAEDDLWTGSSETDIFSTPEEALENLKSYVGIKGYRPDYGFIYDATTGLIIYVISPDQAQIEKAKKEDEEYKRMERAEAAMQAGMAFGCDGYNDYMGYD